MFCVTNFGGPLGCFGFNGTNFVPVASTTFDHDQGQSSNMFSFKNRNIVENFYLRNISRKSKFEF